MSFALLFFFLLWYYIVMKRKVYLSQLASAPLIDYLNNNGFEPALLTGRSPDGAPSPVHEAISSHADIYMCRLGLWEDAAIFTGDAHRLGSDYPQDIVYNAVCTEKFFIHNLKYTDESLMRAAEEWHAARFQREPVCRRRELRFISVPQGYTRCCCLPVDDSAFITSDEGIAKALDRAGADVLPIQKGHIALPGFDYGFIGGCAGHLSLQDINDPGAARRVIVFNGDLASHPDFQDIMTFIKDCGIEPIYFSDCPLTDIGSILAE